MSEFKENQNAATVMMTQEQIVDVFSTIKKYLNDQFKLLDDNTKRECVSLGEEQQRQSSELNKRLDDLNQRLNEFNQRFAVLEELNHRLGVLEDKIKCRESSVRIISDPDIEKALSVFKEDKDIKTPGKTVERSSMVDKYNKIINKEITINVPNNQRNVRDDATYTDVMDEYMRYLPNDFSMDHWKDAIGDRVFCLEKLTILFNNNKLRMSNNDIIDSIEFIMINYDDNKKNSYWLSSESANRRGFVDLLRS